MESLLEKLFANAYELDSQEREAYLSRACGSDAELRLEVQRMLVDAERAHLVLGDEEGEDFSEEEEKDEEAPCSRGFGHVAQDSQIGPYWLREIVGEGGFGIVWKAEQDHPIKRVVALKVLRSGLGTKQVLARFDAERQALALMDHPNIAKVFEAGSTKDGRPYFVMEFIRGETLTNFCDGRNLQPRDRLHIFLELCNAIQHAHQKGVIHRDIKPGNVLVTGQENHPELKVIDFGIAKAMDIQLTEKTLMTGSAQLMGTLQYMSPEQFGSPSGGIDVRTDVYSLGVLLFELLTGNLPHDFQDKPLHELARMVVHDRASRLSTTKSRLRGDLDTIIDKALQKEPARRYDSVSALSADITRYLNREPIAARPTSAIYQLRLFARRNKPLVGGVAAVLVALAAGLIASLIAFSEARREREAARAQVYRASVAAAVLSYQNGDMQEGLAHLENVPPDNRDWIWQLLAARVEEPILSIKGRGIAFTDNGNLRTVTRSGVEEWSVQDGSHRLLARFDQDDPEVSPRFLVGAKFVILSSDVEANRKTFSVLDAESGEVLSQFTSNFDCSLASRRMMAIGRDRIAYKDVWKILVRDLRTGELIRAFPIEKTVVHAISPDGRLLAASNADRGLFLLDVETGKPCPDFKWRGYELWYAAFSPDGKRLITSEGGPSKFGAYDSQDLLEWEVSTGNLVHKRGLRITGQHGTTSRIVYHPDGTRVAIGAGQKVMMVDLASQRTLRTLGGLPETCRRLAVSRDGSMVAAVDRTGQIHRPVGAYRSGRKVHELRYQDDSRILVWASDDPNCLRGHRSYVYPVTFSPDGKRIASGGWDGVSGEPGSVRIWDAESGQAVAAWGEQDWKINALQYSPDGTMLLGSGKFGKDQSGLRIWDAASGALRKRIDGMFPKSSFSPDGTMIAAIQGGWVDPKCSIISLDTMRVTDGPPSQSQTGLVPSPTFSPDGSRVASVLPDLTIAIWEVESRRTVVKCIGHEGAVATIAFNRDGTRLVTASEDDTVRVWNAKTGESIAVLKGPYSDALCAVFAPNGNHVISGSRDGKIRFWNLEEKNVIARLGGHLDYVYSLTISPDGKTIASGSGDHTIRLWGPDPPSKRRRAAVLHRELVGRLTPIVRKLHEELSSSQGVIFRLEESYKGRELEVALQLSLAESLRRAETSKQTNIR